MLEQPNGPEKLDEVSPYSRFTITRSQLAIIWAVGSLLVFVFVYVNIVKPYQVNRVYDERKKAAYSLLKMVLDIPKENRPPDAFIVASEIGLKQHQEITRQQRADPNARSNYFTGAVLPILILGVCAFVTAGRAEPT